MIVRVSTAALLAIGGLMLSACATTPTLSSSGPMVPPRTLETMSVYFEPKYQPGRATGDAHVAEEIVPWIRLLVARLAVPFNASFSNLLAAHGVSVLRPNDVIPVLYVQVITFRRNCHSTNCSTEALFGGDLLQGDSQSLWSFRSWQQLSDMDENSFLDFQKSIVAAMVADGLIRQ